MRNVLESPVERIGKTVAVRPQSVGIEHVYIHPRIHSYASLELVMALMLHVSFTWQTIFSSQNAARKAQDYLVRTGGCSLKKLKENNLPWTSQSISQTRNRSPDLTWL